MVKLSAPHLLVAVGTSLGVCALSNVYKMQSRPAKKAMEHASEVFHGCKQKSNNKEDML